ncbi:Multidrug resistance-associated protein 1 [Lamellibrachia satsuma]|nr:Multidrug resistance-associated protein 1 [Lamellibrachia satsuma]
MQTDFLSLFVIFSWLQITLATFVTFVLTGGLLDAEKAFVSLSLFNILRFPITLLPMIVSYIVTASVSLKRLGRFLQQGDIDFDNVQHDTSNREYLVLEPIITLPI